MKNEMISIIVPIYNVEKYLRDCLESIKKQKYNNFEVLLINDGSTDNSKKICEEFCAEDSRFTLYNKSNGGLSSARNYGISRAKYDYITFIDSDDIVSQMYLKNLYDSCKKNNSDISMIGYKRFYNNVPDLKNRNKIENFNAIQVIEKILYQRNQEFFSVSACGKLYKKKLFEHIRYPESKINEDVAVIVPIIMQCNKISCMYSYDYFYRINFDSITHRKFNIQRMDIIYFSKNIIDEVKFDKKLQKAAINMFFRRNIEMLSEMERVKFQSDGIKEELINNIFRYRKSVLFDINSKISTKIAALISFISIDFVICLRIKLKKIK